MDKISGYLEVGINDKGEIILQLDHDRNGIGYIVFSVNQAKKLAGILFEKANEAQSILEP